MTEASVILCVRNAAATVGAQLAALAGQDCAREWELVVVDNGSTDESVRIVEGWRRRLPSLRLVRANERAGLGYARNAGAAAAAGRVLAFCDADDVADRGWLSALLRGAREAELIGGRLELGMLNGPRARRWRAMSADDLRRPLALGYLHYAVGANFAVAREAFDAVGGCDEAFTICGDDIDLSWRIQRRGGRLAFREDAVMHYRLRANIPGLVRQRYLYGQAEGLLRRKYAHELAAVRWAERWPSYRALLTRCWHLLADEERRGVWLGVAGYSAGRIRGSLRYGVLNY